MNMFKKNQSDSVAEYIHSVPEERRKDITFLHAFIQKHAPDLSVFFAYNMSGYGKLRYTNYKKEIQDWPLIAIANQKNYISVYVCALVDGEYVAEKFKNELGKVSVGRSCIRFKKIEDVNLKTLEKVIKVAVKNKSSFENLSKTVKK